MNNPVAIAAVVIVLIAMLVVFAVGAQLVGLYARALLSGAPVTMLDVLGMKLRRVDARQVINAWIQARREGIDVSRAELEAHVLVGGDLPHVMSALIAAKKLGTELPWKEAAAMDLAQRDVLAYVTSGAHQRGQDWRSAPLRQQQPMI